MNREKWKPVNGNLDYYVSSFGRIISYKRNSPHILNQRLSNCGYQRVLLSINRKKNYPTVHRLVAKAFVPNPLNKPNVNHKDGNKLNNHVSNLEWVTNSENMKHSYANNLHKIRIGENGRAAKLNELQVRVIRKTTGLTQYELADIFRVTQPTISLILTNKKWNHVKSN